MYSIARICLWDIPARPLDAAGARMYYIAMLHTHNSSLHKALGALLIAVTLLISFPTTTNAQIPFGGAIIQYFPGCVAPAGIALTIGPPTPWPLMYIPGASFSFAYGPPAHPGQWLLGMAGPHMPCLIPCTFGLCPYPAQPGGLVILFHGSSP